MNTERQDRETAENFSGWEWDIYLYRSDRSIIHIYIVCKPQKTWSPERERACVLRGRRRRFFFEEHKIKRIESMCTLTLWRKKKKKERKMVPSQPSPPSIHLAGWKAKAMHLVFQSFFMHRKSRRASFPKMECLYVFTWWLSNGKSRSRAYHLFLRLCT